MIYRIEDEDANHYTINASFFLSAYMYVMVIDMMMMPAMYKTDTLCLVDFL